MVWVSFSSFLPSSSFLHRSPSRSSSSSSRKTMSAHTPSPSNSPSRPTASQYQTRLDEQQDEDDDITPTSAPLECPNELKPFGDLPPFSSLVHVLEKVRDVPTMEKKKETLASFFNAWRKRVALDLVSPTDGGRRGGAGRRERVSTRQHGAHSHFCLVSMHSPVPTPSTPHPRGTFFPSHPPRFLMWSSPC